MQRYIFFFRKANFSVFKKNLKGCFSLRGSYLYKKHFMNNKTLTFIEKAVRVHGIKYDYSKVNYINAHTKVCIICPEHGEFWQIPNNHLRGKGCPHCSRNAKMNTEEFIKKAQERHKNKYNYSKVNYINNKTKVCIICPTHGEFWQTPGHHISGDQCPLCAHQSFKDTTKGFVEKAKKVHNTKYNYSKANYINAHTKVCIICPEHGEFWQIPTNHLKGRGCPKCKNERIAKSLTSSRDVFVEKAKKIHGDKYDYSNVDYIKSQKKVCIICPTHGEFWQTPNVHLRGSGCPSCTESHLEREMHIFLERNHIKYERSKHFSWLKKQHLDYFLPDYNIGIECQGEQHFIKAHRFNTKTTLQDIIKRDTLKNKLCADNHIVLLYYSNRLIDSLAKTKPEIYTSNNLFLTPDAILQKIRST